MQSLIYESLNELLAEKNGARRSKTLKKVHQDEFYVENRGKKKCFQQKKK